jgi:hypothetical protein
MRLIDCEAEDLLAVLLQQRLVLEGVAVPTLSKRNGMSELVVSKW